MFDRIQGTIPSSPPMEVALFPSLKVGSYCPISIIGKNFHGRRRAFNWRAVIKDTGGLDFIELLARLARLLVVMVQSSLRPFKHRSENKLGRSELQKGGRQTVI